MESQPSKLREYVYTNLIRFDSFSLRERVLIAATSAVFVFFTWQLLAQSPLERKLLETKRAAQQLDLALIDESARSQSLRQLQKLDPDKAAREEERALRRKLLTVEEQLSRTLSIFVSPRDVASVLESLLVENRNLVLQRVERLPAKPLESRNEIKSDLYLHPIRLEMVGSYLDVLSYIRRLEDASWPLNWLNFNYETTDYPSGLATLEIGTVSEGSTWISQ